MEEKSKLNRTDALGVLKAYLEWLNEQCMVYHCTIEDIGRVIRGFENVVEQE